MIQKPTEQRLATLARQATENYGAEKLVRWLNRPESSLNMAEKLKVQEEVQGYLQSQGINGRGR